MTTVHRLIRPEGTLAYDDTGEGPLVVCLPGMGDLRSEYRFLVPQLADAGFRVVTMDLRGHGDSDATFSDHERTSVGDDVAALLAELDAGPAHLVGTSFGAAAVVWAATQAPDRVASVTLVGPFVRDLPPSPVQRLLMRALLARPWGARAWAWWYGSKLFPGATPPDHAAHVAAVRESLASPERLGALAAMGRAGCQDIDPRLDDLAVPTLVVMGTADPDFPDPAVEAHAIADRMSGQVVMVEGSGHYPHVDAPTESGSAITTFLVRATSRDAA